MRTSTLTLPAIAGLLLLTACSSADPAPVSSPTASATSTASSPTPPTDFVAPVLLTVDPTLIEGIDVEVDESLAQGHYTYEAIPVLPNGDDLTAIMRESIEYRIQRFRDAETSADGETQPELTVSWDIVAASPDILGVRFGSAEVGGENFDGNAQTVWIDLESREERFVPDLFDPAAVPELLDRIVEAGLGDPRIDEELFWSQLDGELEAFDSVAFTPDGDLWVEFDRAQVSTSTEPVGVAVDPDGVLSEFGELARTGALEPADPRLEAVASPSQTPAASEPAAPAPAKTQTASADTDCTVARCIALTFDDGPVEGTHELLDVLDSRGVKATFFMVGKNVTAHPDVVARVADEGHAIGSHTWDHPQLTRLSADEVRKEIAKAADAIEEASGVRTTLLRPPYGATSDTVRDVAADLGMAQILWDVDPEDWKDKDSGIVRDRVLAHAHRDAIILSHDIHPTTRGAYAEIVDALIADGYTLVTVPDLIDDLEPGATYFNGS